MTSKSSLKLTLLSTAQLTVLNSERLSLYPFFTFSKMSLSNKQ